MKTVLFYFASMCAFGFSSIAVAQTDSHFIVCDSLVITTINTDSISSGQLQIEITNNSTQDINYPYIECILNAQGDTVATGGLNSFLQFANSSQNYIVTVNSNFMGQDSLHTIVFVYNNPFGFNTITCQLHTSFSLGGNICDSLAVMNISPDSMGNLTIAILNNSSQFINYPYVAFVLNTQGDTIAHSDMDFYGQMPVSLQNYTVQLDSGHLFNNTTYIVFFRYLDSNFVEYVCPLTFKSSLTALNVPINNGVIIYPNPVVENTVTINCGDVLAKKVLLYNIVGQNVYELNTINQSQFTIDVSSLQKGGYFMELTDINNKVVRQKLIIE